MLARCKHAEPDAFSCARKFLRALVLIGVRLFLDERGRRHHVGHRPGLVLGHRGALDPGEFRRAASQVRSHGVGLDVLVADCV